MKQRLDSYRQGPGERGESCSQGMGTPGRDWTGLQIRSAVCVSQSSGQKGFPGGKPVCALHPFLVRSSGLDLNVSHASHGVGVTEAYAVLSAPVISSPTTECLLELQNFIKMHILIGIFG